MWRHEQVVLLPVGPSLLSKENIKLFTQSAWVLLHDPDQCVSVKVNLPWNKKPFPYFCNYEQTQTRRIPDGI